MDCVRIVQGTIQTGVTSEPSEGEGKARSIIRAEGSGKGFNFQGGGKSSCLWLTMILKVAEEIRVFTCGGRSMN